MCDAGVEVTVTWTLVFQIDFCEYNDKVHDLSYLPIVLLTGMKMRTEKAQGEKAEIVYDGYALFFFFS